MIVRAILLLALSFMAGPAAAQQAKTQFGAEQVGSPHQPYPIGSYAKGCLAGGAQLAETGPSWQAMRLSRNRNWAHPETLAFVGRLSRFAERLRGWEGLYVGDMSQPRGGPMTSGHSSHQTGLDVDVWMRPGTEMRLSPQARESLGSISMQRADGAYVNGNWTRAHHELLKAAASDPAVARIFVFPGAKVQMCSDARGDRSWLRKIRPWWGHHYHFHVRLACPDGYEAACVDQAPPPPGDGCAAAQEWVNDIIDPPPPDPDAPPPQPRRELTMADLPRHCAAVLSP